MPYIQPQIEFFIDDKNLQEMCRLYWLVNDEGEFAHRVTALAKRFGISKQKMAGVVRQHCRAFRTDLVCEKCGQLILEAMGSRSDASISLQDMEFYKSCDACTEKLWQQEKEEQRRQEEVKRKRVEALRKQKREEMRKTFENGVYESLSLLEFNFLVALATSDNATIAGKKVGFSKKDAVALIKKFDNLHLIDYNDGIGKYSFLEELTEALKKIGIHRGSKSIFGSPKAHELYRRLKREHLFVFPEIPICAFISQEQVEHLFTKDWHGMYFLTARVDFVVCDPEGKPEFAIEYQGGYHQSTNQFKKDSFKAKILNEVGLAVRQITNKNLRVFEGI